MELFDIEEWEPMLADIEDGCAVPCEATEDETWERLSSTRWLPKAPGLVSQPSEAVPPFA